MIELHNKNIEGLLPDCLYCFDSIRMLLLSVVILLLPIPHRVVGRKEGRDWKTPHCKHGI
jgi:hypothetical protein